MSLITLDQYLSQSPLPSFQRRPPPSPPLDDDEASSAAAAVEGVALPEEPSAEGMYLTEKPRGGVGFYGEGPGLPPPQLQQQQMMMVLAESSSEDHEMKAPKKRAETWVQEETRSLISLRRELDGLFNTSKSNKHLWEQISTRMREKGFDRSPTMCTDKWRNLLKEFKKAKHQQAKGSGSAKMSYYKELDELLKARNKSPGFKCTAGASTVAPAPKVDTYLQFSDKGLDEANTPFGSAEGPGSCRSALNMDRPLDHDRHPLAITAAEAVAANSVPPWNWRDASANENNGSYGGRVILVKYGEYSRKIGIDGTAEAIKEAIKSAFGLRTKRAFWLEDEDDVVRSLDRDMPLGTYTLHLDEGIKIKICIYDDTDRISVRTEEKIFYTEDDFREFLMHRGWTGLRDLSSFRNVDNLNDLHPGAMYQGVRMLGD